MNYEKTMVSLDLVYFMIGSVYDSVRGPYFLAKRQKWQIDTVDRLFPCQEYYVTNTGSIFINNDQ